LDLKEKHALGDQADTHWYYVSKARMITRHLPRRGYEILDVGAGVGWFSRWLLKNGFGNSAVCVDPGYDTDSKTEVAGKPIFYRREVGALGSDLVLLMDVLVFRV